MQDVFLIALLAFGGISSAEAKTPEWARTNTQSLSGTIFSTTCSGTGPSIDLARKDALDSCKLSARQQLVSSIKVKSLTIQTEQSSGFHEEISENTQYSGLTCTPNKDEVEDLDGSYRVWMQCKFDLSKVSVVTQSDTIQEVPSSNISGDSVKNRDSLVSVEQRQLISKDPQYLTNDQSTLSLSSIPACESLVIRGPKGRVIQCTENPIAIILNQTDEEIIVRANGYKPKTISLGPEKRRHDSVNVILDPL